MKYLAIIGIVVIAFTLSECAERSHKKSNKSEESNEKKSDKKVVTNKVKLIKADNVFLDPEYFAVPKKYEVIKMNDTYNRLETDYEINKDLPEDTKYRLEIFRSDLKCDDYEKIIDITFPFCKPSKYDEYLGSPLTQIKKEGKCVEKGHYSVCDFGYFTFYDLLSEKQLKNAKFIMIRSTIYKAKVLYVAKLEFLSNLH